MVRSAAGTFTLRKLALALLAALAMTAVGLYLATSTQGPLQARHAAAAGDPIYMKFGTIQGDVTALGYEHWIQLNSVQWGVSVPLSTTGGTGVGRPTASDLTITMPSSAASPLFFEQATTGSAQPVKIDFVKVDLGQLQKYMEITLTNAMVTSYQMSSGGDRPSESVSIRFESLAVSEYEVTPTVTFGYDFVRQVRL